MILFIVFDVNDTVVVVIIIISYVTVNATTRQLISLHLITSSRHVDVAGARTVSHQLLHFTATILKPDLHLHSKHQHLITSHDTLSATTSEV